MGHLIRSMDWSSTPLGPVEFWPQSLRTTVNICLASDLPICVIWGQGLVQLYNDGYRVICGGKHPRSMGQNFAECWKEAWPVIGAAHDSARAGDTAFLESQQIFLERHGFLEECFFTFSFSPIRDEVGRVGGLFHPVIEMTTTMLGERRTRALRDLAARTSNATTVSAALALAAEALAAYELDLPFLQLFELDATGEEVRLAGSAGVAPTSLALPGGWESVEHSAWPLADVVRTGSAVHVDDVMRRIGAIRSGGVAEETAAALAMPIIPPGGGPPAAVLIAGISARLPFGEAYRGFFDLVASGVKTAVANARAYEEARARADALAELDRVKTAFFSNVSHEFRTPLTLMLGPVTDMLANADASLAPSTREQLEIVHRNTLRLQRLVNSLLDFSRIEAGRASAHYESTDLSTFTADLASNFRSACEKAGLRLNVDCAPLGDAVFVDRTMWEKIVLNLLSNAFKFTFAGHITVAMRQGEHAITLRVQDTGTGIPADELPRLFERFHRIEKTSGRTHEGSGIGLALVQELVKLHGGSIVADSQLGRGTEFTVSIPLGTDHLPRGQIATAGTTPVAVRQVNQLVEEALRWLPDDAAPADPGAASPACSGEMRTAVAASDPRHASRPRVLVADDNADMREYIARLLSTTYRVETVANGEAAVAAVARELPDLLVSDVMMPRLDGIGLLRALRNDPRTVELPVVLLSARAGEESRVEGLRAGADDYLVKPFSARELLARVGALLHITGLRRDANIAIRASEERFRALVSASSDVVYRMNADWTEMHYLDGRAFIVDTFEPSKTWLDRYIHPDDQQHVLTSIHDAIRDTRTFELEHRIWRVDGTLGWTFSRAIPILDKDGRIVEWFGMASDVTARKEAEQALRHSEEKFRTLFASMDQGFCVITMLFDDTQPTDYRFVQVNPAFAKQSGFRDAEGKRMRELAPDHDEYWGDVFGQIAITGEPMRFVRQAQAPDSRWLDVFAFRLGDPASLNVAILFTDITPTKHAEQERESLLHQLREQDRRKDEFLATLAHELRNPLAPMSNGLEVIALARGHADTVEAARALVKRQLQHLVRLVDDLLDVSRISLGKFELKRAPIPLAAVVQSALETSRALIEQMGHSLTLEVASEPILVDGDLTRLSQVVSNLLNNSAKYTERGGHVRLLVEQQNGNAIITVEDDGIGMSTDMLSRVFDMFAQLDQSLERSRGGLGIGLSLVRRLVELHGGTVEALSKGLGTGSTFVVRLPLASLQDDAVLPAAVRIAATVERLRVLVADDNTDSAASLSLLLNLIGYETQTANDGLEAVDVAASFRPHVALLDIGMPGLNGYDACRRIRTEPWGTGMMLVALTGWGQNADKQQSFASGFDLHMVKPLDLPALQEVLEGVRLPAM